MNATRRSFFLLTFAAFVGSSTLHADDTSKTPTVTALADLDLKSDGKDVTMIFKITKTQLIGGAHEGEFPNAILHYAEMKEAPHLVVYAKGELADALHRFACIGPKGRLIGRSIKVSGKIKTYTDFPEGEDQTPIYNLNLRDWKAFQILPEPEEK
ncbi:hypothetical protein [Aureliella helgolandensis]|uniref:Uncharacterized protein n=1 Tax=Aureliella helgolandensis TaxID=2527968 RepID=A0A518G2R5_9BACT|nr:hypothetical protein [Aureliella helgolandensis]QDV22893.1 hypothetical protein Q31a_11860 [Aureliella helgolandensis]